ncbi:MAG: hypothetical protein SOW31_11590 [Treponema sp.]|nr:hypothetical protein [Treponema sp.]
MKIKVIELLTKISIGEIPKKIKFKNNIYVFKEDSYYTEFENVRIHLQIATNLNDEVEIIEEPKKIEKISWREKESLAGNLMANEKQEILARRTEKLKSSLNELIDEINNLKEEK